MRVIIAFIACALAGPAAAQHEHHSSEQQAGTQQGGIARPASAEASPARQFFDRLRSLEGQWGGRSTRGWEDVCSFKTIAGGSCVVETSFDAHPNETMLTLYHMDGEQLMLTHYCVAKNQPRLRATEFSPDGTSATFTFVDATNLASRDKGHMDKCVITIPDGADTFSARWTWYQAGQESWMEEIHHERKRDAAGDSEIKPGPLDSFGFLAGQWRGTFDGSVVEENWSQPVGTSLMGTFRWLGADGLPVMFEMLTITRESDQTLLRLRHYSPALSAKEERPMTLSLADQSARRVRFDAHSDAGDLASCTYEVNEAGDSLTITVAFADAGREALVFVLNRVR